MDDEPTARTPRVSEMPRAEHMPWGRKQRGTWFTPADQAAHEQANEGVNIDDPCTCGVDFMGHVNGRCPS